MKIEESKLELSASGFEDFQTVFQKLYKHFMKSGNYADKVIIRQDYWSSTDEEKDKKKNESADLWNYGYQEVKRILSNLNLHKFVIVVKRKPIKLPKSKERIYSHLEVYPTEKGFNAFKKGDYCPIKPVKIYVGGGYPEYKYELTSDKIGIGKGCLGYEHYLKIFEKTKENLHISMSQWDKNWELAFHMLFRTKLCAMHEKDAQEEIIKLIQQLVPTLPRRRNDCKAEKLKESAKLEIFV